MIAGSTFMFGFLVASLSWTALVPAILFLRLLKLQDSPPIAPDPGNF